MMSYLLSKITFFVEKGKEKKRKEKKRKVFFNFFLVSINYNQGILLYHIEKSHFGSEVDYVYRFNLNCNLL